jgi:hypothetical protein
MIDYSFHPAASVFPLLAGAEFKELVASIKTHGYDPRHPILLFENTILDGRNRYLAARKAGVKPVFIQWQPNGLDPFAFAWQENAIRRHLEPGTKACCYAKRLASEVEWRASRQAAKEAANQRRSASARQRKRMDTSGGSRFAAGPSHLSRDKTLGDHRHVQAARAAGVSPATMGRAFALQSSRPDLFEQVCGREITMIEALRLKRKAEVRAAVQALPRNKFRVIYADPPFSYSNIGYSRIQVEEHYPSMPLAAICAIDGKSIVHHDAVLFL